MLCLIIVNVYTHFTANPTSHCITDCQSSDSPGKPHPSQATPPLHPLPQDDITGDGTTSNVLIIGELMKQADLYISEGLHPRIITEGFEKAKGKALQVS